MKHPFFLLRAMLFASIVCVGTACEKSGPCDPPEDGPGVLKKVKRVIAGPNDYFSFQYNAQQSVINYSSSWTYSPDGPTIRTYTVNYQYVNEKLAEANIPSGSRKEFLYEGNQLVQSKHFHHNGVQSGVHLYQYNNQRQLVEILENILEPEDIQQTRIQLSYYENGNLHKMVSSIKRTGSTDFEHISTIVYEAYDTHWNSIPAEIWGDHLPGLQFHRNNVLRMRHLLPDGSTERIIRMQYVYDGDGYPVQQTQQVEINGTLQPAIIHRYEY